MKKLVSFRIEYTTGCCGVRQLCFFSHSQAVIDDWVSNIPDYLRASKQEALGKTDKEAYKNLFDQLIETKSLFGYVCQIWFRKSRTAKVFAAEPFRELIQTIPDVIDLGAHRNPNTGNTIQGYQFVLKKPKPQPKAE